MSESERLSNLRKAFCVFRRGLMALEMCGGVSLLEARAMIQMMGAKLQEVHREAAVCLGCASIRDEPMTGYTSICVECGTSHTHPVLENSK